MERKDGGTNSCRKTSTRKPGSSSSMEGDTHSSSPPSRMNVLTVKHQRFPTGTYAFMITSRRQGKNNYFGSVPKDIFDFLVPYVMNRNTTPGEIARHDKEAQPQGRKRAGSTTREGAKGKQKRKRQQKQGGESSVQQHTTAGELQTQKKRGRINNNTKRRGNTRRRERERARRVEKGRRRRKRMGGESTEKQFRCLLTLHSLPCFCCLFHFFRFAPFLGVLPALF